MKIINEPRYQDFNGKIYKTEKQCRSAEDALVGNIFQVFEELMKGCKNQESCKSCPFYENIHNNCIIEEKTGHIPANWKI